MEAQEQRYPPGRIHILHLKRGSAIVALDGRLRIRYRDESLNWFPDSVPAVSRLLQAGECHVIPYRGYVEICATGAVTVTGLVLPPALAKSRVAAIARFLSRGVARLMRRNPATRNGSSLSG